MSYRYNNAFVKPGLNTLVAPPAPTYEYNLYSWGANRDGCLGIGGTANKSSPNQVGSLTDWLIVAGGTYYALSVKKDNTLWAWGRNTYGNLGLNNTTNYSSPKQVGSLTNWATVSCAIYLPHTLAVKTDGTLWSWGVNNYGQLGLNNTTYKSSPTQVGTLTNWLYVSAGYAFSIATKTDGTIWSWGRGASYGALGLGNTTNYSSPKQIGSLTNWLKAATGYGHCIALKTDGTLWGWGRNNAGQLGRNNTSPYSSPVQVGTLTNWSKISLGTNCNLATKSDGTLWSWGSGAAGALGLGNTTNYSSPKQIGALTNWATIGTCVSSGAAIKTDGTLWTWGQGYYGQLGLGNTTYYSSPKQVGAVTTWLTVAGGQYSMYARG